MKKLLMLAISVLLWTGSEVAAQDWQATIRQWTKDAAAGDVEAAYNLGLIYYRGEGGVTPNLREALSWWTRAAEGGFVQAQYNLGYAYYAGEGVMQDYAQAVKWFTLAANQGFAQAQSNLGSCFYQGRASHRIMPKR